MTENAHLPDTTDIERAINWYKSWHSGLSHASEAYFGRNNAQECIAILSPLHESLDAEETTAYQECYRADLMRTKEHCRDYQETGDNNQMQLAWDVYYSIYRRLCRRLPQLEQLKKRDRGTELQGSK